MAGRACSGWRESEIAFPILSKSSRKACPTNHAISLFFFIRSRRWQHVQMMQPVEFAKPKAGQNIQLRVLSEVNDGPWALAAAIGVIVK